VNNETGVVLDLVEVVKAAQKYSTLLHLDGAQAWGKLSFQIAELGAHYVTFSGHKIGGLAGTGLVWLAKNTKIHSTLLGKQEKGRRGGTENLLGTVALGAAASEINPLRWAEQLGPLRDRLQDAICTRIPGTQVNGGGAPRVANTLNLSFVDVEGDGLVMALDLAGYSVSSGSACSSGVLEPSHVLMAMGRTQLQAMAAVRISLSQPLPSEAMEEFVKTMEKVVSRVRKASSHPDALALTSLRSGELKKGWKQ
jgi:cysteine desulfurase